MAAAVVAPLSRRGVGVGVLMGTSYLFTREAVEHRAILPLFQRMAVLARETALLETAPGHVTRALNTAFVGEFSRQRAELTAAGTPNRDIWVELELLNTGRLRLATKGVQHDGTEIDEAAQATDGLYMAGQVAVLRDAETTVPALHAEVTSGASRFHAERLAQLHPLATAAAPGEDGQPGEAGPLDIAVVGMAGMFADSPGMDAFWRLILSGRDAFREVPAERWDPAIYYTPDLPGSQTGRRSISKWGSFLRPVPIDPISYGIPPAALGSIDPSQLLALEAAKSALQDSGYPYDEPGADHSRTGVVFAAEPGSDTGGALAMRALLPAYLGELPAQFDEQLPTFTEDTFPGHLPNVIAGRIANRFDLGGANFTVDAACAASLAAVDVACKQLTTGGRRPDAVRGGGPAQRHRRLPDVRLGVRAVPHRAGGHLRQRGGWHRPRRGRRLRRAQAAGRRPPGRRPHLRGNQGRRRGQRRPGPEPHRAAGGGPGPGDAPGLPPGRLSPAEVSLVEAHGTGTVLGDQVELESLTEVFTQAGARPGGCVLGSVKSQIGHAKCAAGLAGLIKAVLAVYHGVQPPTSNLVQPNRAWDAGRSPFTFLTRPRPWLAPPAQRVAGLSAFGFGGTNFHVVLAGHAATPEPRHALGEWPAELFCFRGTDRAAAHRAAADLAGLLAEAEPGVVRLRDLAAHSARTAEAAGGPVRLAVVARDTGELAALLGRALAGEHDPAAGLIQPPDSPPDRPAVAFLFPGQGSQRTGALGELFVAFPELRQYLQLGQRWAGRLFPPAAFTPEREREQADLLRDTRTAQPVMGMCGLAASHLLGRLGVRPDMAGGHSYGELVALCTAGAFDPVTLLDLSDARGTAMLSAAGEDPGTMAAVSGGAGQISEALRAHGAAAEVTLANLNAPGQVVISGPTGAMDRALTALRQAGLTARRLPVACAFHSPVVAAASERFAAVLAGRPMAAPQLPVWSNRTAAPYPADPESIRAELAAQISAPVRFADQVEAMYAAGARVFVEAGPGAVLTGLVRAVLGDRPHVAVPATRPGRTGCAAS